MFEEIVKVKSRASLSSREWSGPVCLRGEFCKTRECARQFLGCKKNRLELLSYCNSIDQPGLPVQPRDVKFMRFTEGRVD